MKRSRCLRNCWLFGMRCSVPSTTGLFLKVDGVVGFPKLFSSIHCISPSFHEWFFSPVRTHWPLTNFKWFPKRVNNPLPLPCPTSARSHGHRYLWGSGHWNIGWGREVWEMKVWELQKDFKLQPEPSRLVGGLILCYCCYFVFLFLVWSFMVASAKWTNLACSTPSQNTRCHNPSTM